MLTYVFMLLEHKCKGNKSKVCAFSYSKICALSFSLKSLHYHEVKSVHDQEVISMHYHEVKSVHYHKVNLYILISKTCTGRRTKSSRSTISSPCPCTIHRSSDGGNMRINDTWGLNSITSKSYRR